LGAERGIPTSEGGPVRQYLGVLLTLGLLLALMILFPVIVDALDA
jgi:hypothetical protein